MPVWQSVGVDRESARGVNRAARHGVKGCYDGKTRLRWAEEREPGIFGGVSVGAELSMESLFGFLFKYRPFYFQKGEFTWQWGLPWWQASLVLLALVLFVFWVYRRRWLATASPAGKWLFALRTCALALLALLAMRPSLVLSSLVPRENILAVLVDNSRSMGIADAREERGKPAVDLLKPDSDFVKALEAKFFLRAYRFAARAESSPLPLTLDWSGDQTNISAALDRVLADTRNLPLAGVVLLSDGSDNSFRSFREPLAELSARQVPIYTVGFGPETVERDVELTQVSAARTALPDSVVSARVAIKQSGFGGSRGRLDVREGTSLVQSVEVYFPRESNTVTVDVAISPKTQGVKTYQFSLEPLEGERITQNNTLATIVRVRDDRPRILYVEGHPRWEFKFIRQAMSKDGNIRLETLLRTALNKLYRQGIEEETTLAAGFPNEREALFQYQGIIFGDIESSFFTYPQMEMVRDFVSKRGGGFMMLGGGSAFSGGGYQNTPIEQILPVALRAGAKGEEAGWYQQGQGMAAITPQGEAHPALSLALDSKANRKAWADMPPLIDWNLAGDPKAGATVLAQLNAASTSGKTERGLPLLAFQRFGRGQAIALLSGSSWRWQMQRPSDDQGHETFWRQMTRWLVALAKEPVSVETERETYSRNEVVRLRAEVSDKSYNRVNDALVEADVRSPSGESVTLPLRWSAREDGVYEGELTPDQDGLYQVSVRARTRSSDSGGDYGQALAHFMTATGVREYFDPAQRKPFLTKLAEDSGGRYYSLQDVAKLPEEIVYTERKTSTVEVLDLWDMPINLLLLLGLLIGEWILRRRHGTI